MPMEKIMVADDDKNICELLRLYLEKEQYTVVTANDGNEALARFAAEAPALILLDIMMPGLDGWQVCREIRKKSNV
ncbi:MAG: response regulator, partial [Oscillospiraceae bacterium]